MENFAEKFSTQKWNVNYLSFGDGRSFTRVYIMGRMMKAVGGVVPKSGLALGDEVFY